jgi:hypothetical protein
VRRLDQDYRPNRNIGWAYGAIRADAKPVEISNIINKIDETLAPYGVGQDVAANDTAAAALAQIRSRA